MKKYLFVAALFLVVMTFVTPILAHAGVRLYTGPVFSNDMCTGESPTVTSISSAGKFCTLCDFLKVFENLVNLTITIVFPFAAIGIIYGGFLVMFSRGKPDGIKKGWAVIWKMVEGIIIILGAWLIIDTVLGFIGTGALKGPWYELKCGGGGNLPAVTSALQNPQFTPATVPPAPESLGGEAGLAAEILKRGLVGGTPSCGGVGPRETLEAVVDCSQTACAGIPVCSSGCTKNTPCKYDPNLHLNRKMLSAIDTMNVSGDKFIVTSLTTGPHDANSDHYKGNGADIVSAGTPYTKLQSDFINRGATFTQCEIKGGEVPCDGSKGKPDHLHVSYR